MRFDFLPVQDMKVNIQNLVNDLENSLPPPPRRTTPTTVEGFHAKMGWMIARHWQALVF